MRQGIFYLLLLFFVGFFSCNNAQNPNAGKPIVLGDPSTIVTETDSQYLQDFVADINLIKAPQPEVVNTPAPTADTATAKPAETAPEPPKENGLTVKFKEVTVFIPDIETKTYGDQNTENANGASYEITKGELQGNELKIINGTVEKVSQRYQTVVYAKNDLGILMLESLNDIDEWRPVKGSNNVYPIKGLGKRELDYKKPSKAAIRAAVAKAVKNARLSKAKQNKWISSLKNVSSVKQKPLHVELRSVMWKIDGKDASGKHFQKQLRIDIPIE